MIEIVFHLVVFWETQQVAVLHVHKVLRLKGTKMHDAHPLFDEIWSANRSAIVTSLATISNVRNSMAVERSSVLTLAFRMFISIVGLLSGLQRRKSIILRYTDQSIHNNNTIRFKELLSLGS